MHGARRSHEIYGVSLDLALQIEEAEEMDETIAGMSLDKKKFFDLLECEVIFSLWRMMGVPEEYVRAEERLYRDLVTRYKVGEALSEEYTRTNGFVQGLSGSVQAALTIMAIWDRVVKEVDPCIRAGGFVDDANIRAQGNQCVDSVIKAWGAFKKFDELAGMQCNKKKTKAYATGIKNEKRMNKILKDQGDMEVEMVSNFVLVGGNITVKHHECLK